MTRTSHFNAASLIPVYALTFLDDQTLLYAGGGGAGRSGVSNAIRCVQINKSNQSIQLLNEMKLSRDEDAPMAIDLHHKSATLICAVNSVQEELKKSNNQVLRLFDTGYKRGEGEEVEKEEKVQEGEVEKEVKENGGSGEVKQSSTTVNLSFTKSEKSLNITDPEQYVKVIRFSPDGRMLTVGSTDGQVNLHKFPSFQPVWPSSTNSNSTTPTSIPDFISEELYDSDFSEDNRLVAIASASKLKIYDTSSVPSSSPSASSSEERLGIPLALQTIQNPALGGSGPCSFRASRFGRGDPLKGGTRERLFTVVNAKTAKGKVRKSFVSSWDADTWELVETRNVSDKPVTAFDVSSDGKLLAYGSSDLSVGVLDAVTLRPILRILHAHSFPPTCLKFSPSGSTLVSASADNTLRIISVPTVAVSSNKFMLALQEGGNRFAIMILTVLLLIVAFLLQKYLI